MGFIVHVINNFTNIIFYPVGSTLGSVGNSIETLGGTIVPSTTTVSASAISSAGLNMLGEDNSTLGVGVMTLGSAVSSAAFQTNEINDTNEQVAMNVSTQYVESLSDSELNDLTSRLENIINEDKPKVLAKTYKPNKRI